VLDLDGMIRSNVLQRGGELLATDVTGAVAAAFFLTGRGIGVASFTVDLYERHSGGWSSSSGGGGTWDDAMWAALSDPEGWSGEDLHALVSSGRDVFDDNDDGRLVVAVGGLVSRRVHSLRIEAVDGPRVIRIADQHPSGVTQVAAGQFFTVAGSTPYSITPLDDRTLPLPGVLHVAD
jgi:hypothetical protein